MQDILESLKRKGYRITSPRQKVLHALSDYPQSVQEIASFLKRQKENVDLVSIYRTLEVLVGMGAVAKTQFLDGVAKYERTEESSHHHHLVCERCGTVKNISVNYDPFVKTVVQQAHRAHFSVKTHALEFFGLCTRCQ